MAAAAPGNAERQRDLSLSAAKLAILQRERGDLDAAESSLRHALAISERAYGPDHPDAAGALAAKLKESAPAIGLDIGRLTDVETRLRTVTVTQGLGARIHEVRGGRLEVDELKVGPSAKK